GNYDTYYNYRNPGAADDPRLEVFEEAWFQGKRALDIGCNSGSVTMEIAERFKPRHIMGFDIDNALIAKARANLLTRPQPQIVTPPPKKPPLNPTPQPGRAETQPPRMPNPQTQRPRALGGQENQGARFSFPFNCSFKKEDYCNEAEIDARYDVITCLSVTKWVHFNRGDEGVKLLFSKVHRALKEGGRFILEWQEWGSYKKKKTLTPLFKANCAAIKLHPGRFKEYLLNEVGFKSATVLTPRKGKSEGFQRPLVVFQK
ncbi:Bicoid-interacting protein 3-domain-containing protein, partial [Baffinella frigidus]